MDDETMARTESAFREVNEAIAGTAARFGSGDAYFVCECADPECAQRVEMTLPAYDELRADPTRFVLAPEHHVPGRERVVGRTADYETVEKLGARMRRIVRRLDPRARPQPEIT
jgi:hypothetical protein